MAEINYGYGSGYGSVYGYKVSVCIACYKNDPFLKEALSSIEMQTYKDIETCIYYDNEGVGTGEAFNRAIAMAKGDIIVLLCSDDLFTDKNVISDIVAQFDNPEIGHVSRWYHQFVDYEKRDRNLVGYKRCPVRAWRGEDVMELANNPSGMAFKNVLQMNTDFGRGLTNKMFVEVAQLVSDVINDGWAYSILRYDTVAVRIHKSISRTPGYYKKMWNSSPVLEWSKLGWKMNDFTHLIQVGVNFTKKAVLDESLNFIRVNPWNLFNPCFWFFSMVALITPRSILFVIPEWYRRTWGRWTTREVKRHGRLPI